MRRGTMGLLSSEFVGSVRRQDSGSEKMVVLRRWFLELRAEPRRRGSRPTSWWLKEEGGVTKFPGEGSSSGVGFNVGSSYADPARSNNNNRSMQPNSNPHTIIAAPSDFAIQFDLITVPQSNINNVHQSIMAATQSLLHNCPTQSSPINALPLNINSAADNTVITPSLPNHEPTITSTTISPLINESINQPPNFAFQSSPLTRINLNLTNRPNNLNPT
ncbi:hypothetical protein TSUD_240850 [Trifolium subterraneum]|uniref:Uncharacterized protein n=1 Tax=Trifolium subterraneum TaxID=3900 RepID=A0A2Z6NUH5_TRISU|nr:hypothetical protein TSUD_240850 [Trifolium subterraneum]